MIILKNGSTGHIFSWCLKDLVCWWEKGVSLSAALRVSYSSRPTCGFRPCRVPALPGSSRLFFQSFALAIESVCLIHGIIRCFYVSLEISNVSTWRSGRGWSEKKLASQRDPLSGFCVGLHCPTVTGILPV